MGDTAVLTRPQTRPRPEVRRPRRWNVVLLDDQEHSYEYVILMLQELFGFEIERAYTVAKKVDEEGRGVCMTTHREHAELKVEQIHGYGPDGLIAECQGSMSATLEPADFDDDDDGDDVDR